MPIIPLAGTSAPKGAVVPIATVSLGSSGGAVFSNIPQIYQDLTMVLSTRDTNPSTTPVLFNYINGDSSALYSFITLNSDGTTTSGRVTSTNSFGTALQTGDYAYTGLYASNTYHFLNYASTSTFKTVMIQSAANNVGGGSTRLSLCLYRSTNAIQSIWVNPATSFASGSTATLYGIRSVNQ